MSAARKDLVIEKGATFRRLFTWKTDLIFSPVDLTGCTVKMQIRKDYNDTAVILELSTEGTTPYITLNPRYGEIYINVPSDITRTLPIDRGHYDLEVTHPDESVTRLLYGVADIKDEITL